MSLPPSLYHPPSSYTLVHGRIGRALSGKVRRVAVFLGCEKVFPRKKTLVGESKKKRILYLYSSSLSRARAHAHKTSFFLRARPTRARKSQTLLSSIDLSIDDRGWKGGSSFLHRLLFLLEMHKSSVFFVSMKSENGR